MVKMVELQDGNGSVRISEQQLQVLEKQVVGNGTLRLPFQVVRKHYSSREAAKNALGSLESKGIVEKYSEGVYRISNLPEELYRDWVK